MTESVLVVAFDGLDSELVEEFDCDNLKQREYGSFDNTVFVDKIVTSEIFATLITGKPNQVHGIHGLRKWTNSKLGKFEEKVKGNRFFDKFRGLRHRAYKSLNPPIEERVATKDDLKCTTIFEEIDNSKALFVPGYNPSYYQDFNIQVSNYRDRYQEDRDGKFYVDDWKEIEYPRRKRKLFRPVNRYFDFCMCHFHLVDHWQHCYGDKNLPSYNEKKLEEIYKETDELAGEIKEYFSDSYDHIVFLSDHGLPDGGEHKHNLNAFYSCNQELFGRKPRLNEFFGKFLEIVEDRISVPVGSTSPKSKCSIGREVAKHSG